MGPAGMEVLLMKSVVLVPVAALSYAVATLGIKMYSGVASSSALFLIVGGFGLATLAEIVLLRRAELGVIYLAVLSFETLAILSIAAAIGEGLNLRQLAGAGLVLGGIFLVGFE